MYASRLPCANNKAEVNPFLFATSLNSPARPWTMQLTPELGKRDELSLTHFPFGLFHESACFRGEHVVGLHRSCLKGCSPHRYVPLDFTRMAEIPTTLRSGNFRKMIRYGPTRLRSRPFHSGPCNALMLLHWGSSFASSSSMAREMRSRTLRGNRASCSWASSDSSARQRMFHGAPGFRLAAFELGFAAPYDLRLGGR